MRSAYSARPCSRALLCLDKASVDAGSTQGCGPPHQHGMHGSARCSPYVGTKSLGRTALAFSLDLVRMIRGFCIRFSTTPFHVALYPTIHTGGSDNQRLHVLCSPACIQTTSRTRLLVYQVGDAQRD
ncbi:hypothetical protein F4813DRAFT_195379 [Daldinia decipiens]|uniref:uncharacterized protein n=1 Tax=Daldinia decipiens TaxID=326647 RepID=UPI0020C309A6|nr:uncharacterized protein F4813DRAFT_195379 [Daldinia decipiens]KAI1654766.1 hypothetical protein F4813DRAFT_195379 [Daldinia decipiens]